jgi:hypothetical protein
VKTIVVGRDVEVVVDERERVEVVANLHRRARARGIPGKLGLDRGRGLLEGERTVFDPRAVVGHADACAATKPANLGERKREQLDDRPGRAELLGRV